MAELHELDGPVLLLAGPGTGKTYRLACRIKHLVEVREVDPSEIMVITFTNAAAANMQRRISDEKKPNEYVPVDKRPSRICTMNSLGHRIVTENAAQLGLPDPPKVLPSDLERVLMADAAQLTGNMRAFGEKDVCDCRRRGDCRPRESKLCRTCEQYKAILTACGAVDFQSQLFLACKLLREDDTLLDSYRAQTRHLLVDEYQDINPSQFELIQLLSRGQTEGLFVVGDDDQSIYSWRGGSPVYIRAFGEHYGEDARVESLNHSYRCHPKVLEGAIGVVNAHDDKRLDKGRYSYEVEDGPAIAVHNAASDGQEAEVVAAIAKRAVPSNDVLVLVPTRNYVPAIARALRRRGVPFVGVGRGPGPGLPLLVGLRGWLDNRGDNIALRRCIEAMMANGPLGVPSKRARKAAKKKEREDAYAKVSALWEAVVVDGISLWESLDKARQKDALAEAVHEGLSQLADLQDGEVAKFLEAAARVLRPWAKTKTLLGEVAGWLRQAESATGDSGPPMVRVMTFEQAKGLEADVVCAVGLEDGVVPRADTDDKPEQARKFFVSMTRAVRELHLFHARRRSAAVSYQSPFGKGGKGKLSRSPFLDAIPVACQDGVYHKPST
jgi:DNA helicase-2/ATP-dependent DNA helicase PcrA